MSKNLLRKILTPYTTIEKINIPVNIIELESTYNSFDVQELYEEIQDEITYRNIDTSIYNKCISFAVSSTMIDFGKFKIYINNKTIEDLDIKYFLLHGYLYIIYKDNFSIDNILYLGKEDEVMIHKDLFRNGLEKEGKDVSLNLVNSKFIGLSSVILGDYFVLEKDKSNIDYLYEKYGKYYYKYLFSYRYAKVYIYNENKGFIDDISKVKSYPLYIKNVSTDANDKVIVFYERENIIDKTSLYYPELSFIFHKDNIFKYYIENIEDLSIPSKNVIYNKEFSSNEECIYELFDFNWDAFKLIQAEYERVNLFYNDENIDVGGTLELLTDVIYKPIIKKFSYRNYIKLTFPNPHNLYPEVFHEGRFYSGYKLVEKNINMTTVAIKYDVLKDYYNIKDDKDMVNIYVVLRPSSYMHSHYHNITEEYNGVIPIGRQFYMYEDKRRYINGYIANDNELGFNTIPPYNLLCAFPRRNHKTYHMVDTGYRTKVASKKTIRVKYRNHTQSEIDSIIESNDKFIYKGFLYTDYIDYKFQLYCGPYILQEGYDYIILSPRLIKFLNPLYKYKEENINTDYVDIAIENLFDNNEAIELHKEKAYKSSYLKTLFENKEFMKKIFNEFSDIEVLNKKKTQDCPSLYDESIYRNHMYLTKYFSSELILTGEADEPYGEKWYEKIENEFPEFITSDGVVITDMEIDNDKTINDFPRIVQIPENEPLNILIGSDIIAKRKLRHENLHIPNDIVTDDFNNKLFNKTYYSKDINLIFHLRNVKYIDTIPFDAIYYNE